jgi:hypothetical protein
MPGRYAWEGRRIADSPADEGGSEISAERRIQMIMPGSQGRGFWAGSAFRLTSAHGFPILPLFQARRLKANLPPGSAVRGPALSCPHGVDHTQAVTQLTGAYAEQFSHLAA